MGVGIRVAAWREREIWKKFQEGRRGIGGGWVEKKGISAWISCLGWAQHLGIRALLWKWMGRGVGRWDLGDRE